MDIEKLNKEDGISLMAYAVLLQNQTGLSKVESALESLKDVNPEIFQYVINNVEYNPNGNALDIYSSVIEDEAMVEILQTGRIIKNKKNDTNIRR